MEENRNEDKVIDTEELKKETTNTVNQVKDTIKNVDIKNDTKEAAGFVSAMFKDPFAKIREIANDNTNKYFKIAIVFIAIWMIVSFIGSIWSNRYSNAILNNTLDVIKDTIAPVIGIIVLSVIIFIMNKKEKKSVITIATAIVTAKIPIIISSTIRIIKYD